MALHESEKILQIRSCVAATMKSTEEDDRVHEIREAAESVEAFAVVSFRRTLLEKEFEEKALNALKSASNSEN